MKRFRISSRVKLLSRPSGVSGESQGVRLFVPGTFYLFQTAIACEGYVSADATKLAVNMILYFMAQELR